MQTTAKYPRERIPKFGRRLEGGDLSVEPNLLWRKRLLAEGGDNPTSAAQLRALCRQDILFWVNAFLWLYEPRNQDINIIPFVTFDFQDGVLLDLEEAIGKHDYLIEKSRDEGATWMCLVSLLHCWQFQRDQAFLVISRKEELVYKKGDKKALFEKLRFLLEKQPKWLLPLAWEMRKNHLENFDLSSTIEGEATVESAGAGDRCKAVFIDEFPRFKDMVSYEVSSATRDVTYSRLVNGTPHGPSGAYYDWTRTWGLRHRARLHWSDDPRKNRGLYTEVEGEVTILHPEDGYVFAADFRFQPCDIYKVRSPWFDNECTRASSDKEIAQELEINYLDSQDAFFNRRVLADHIRDHARPPVLEGALQFEAALPTKFQPEDDGAMRLWCKINAAGRPPLGEYAIGVDVSGGTGASFSALAIGNVKTGEKICEWARNDKKPHEWADMVVSTARWFYDAFIIWENHGAVGVNFYHRMEALEYHNLYRKREGESPFGKPLHKFGFFPGQRTKKELLVKYAEALQSSKFVNPSEPALEECRQFFNVSPVKVEHQKSEAKAEDASSRGENHGDQVIADALLWHLITTINRNIMRVPKGGEAMVEEDSLALRERYEEDRDRMSPLIAGAELARERREC